MNYFNHKISTHVVTFLLLILLSVSTAYAGASHDIDALVDSKTHSAQPIVASSTETSSSEAVGSWNNFNQQYALVVFFSSTCPHCIRFTPIIQAFATQHSIKVFAYTIDGNGVEAFPTPMLATDEVKAKFYQSMQVVVPAVFAVNTQTFEITPIDIGEESAADFENDMNKIAQSIKG